MTEKGGRRRKRKRKRKQEQNDRTVSDLSEGEAVGGNLAEPRETMPDPNV